MQQGDGRPSTSSTTINVPLLGSLTSSRNNLATPKILVPETSTKYDSHRQKLSWGGDGDVNDAIISLCSVGFMFRTSKWLNQWVKPYKRPWWCTMLLSLERVVTIFQALSRPGFVMTKRLVAGKIAAAVQSLGLHGFPTTTAFPAKPSSRPPKEDCEGSRICSLVMGLSR